MCHWGNTGLTRSLQDRPQRLLEEAGRHHCAGEAIRCQGYQREGEGHDGGLSGNQQLRGNFFLCFGASRAVLGKGLLFVCDCLAPTQASEYNCGLLRHGQTGNSRRRLVGFSIGVTGAAYPGPSGDELTNDITAGTMNQKKYPRFPPICNVCPGTVTRMSKMMFVVNVCFFLTLVF